MFRLKRASYKKVSFLIRLADTRGGRKDTLHSYPGSDRQSIEDLGLKPRTFFITIVINNDRYERTRDAVLNILDEPGNGVLAHPTFGLIDNVVVRRWTIREKIDELGSAEIVVEFGINNAPAIPRQTTVLADGIEDGNNSLGDALNDKVSGDFDVDTGLVGNYESAVSNLEKIGDLFDSFQDSSNALIDQIDDYNSVVTAFTDSINSLVNTPASLANSLATLFSSLNTLFDAPSDTYGAFVSLFNFSFENTMRTPNTPSRQERLDNDNILEKNINIQALGYAYEAASTLDFDTTDEVDNVNSELEDQYGLAIDPLLEPEEIEVDIDNGLSDAILEELNDLRLDTLEFLDNERLTSKQIVNFTVPNSLPISVIAYRLYGSTELTDTLVALNGINQSAFVQGDIKVLSE